jgi:hypothetical protein
MKNKKIIGAFIALTAILTSCNQTEFDAPKMENQAKWTPTHTISDFIKTYASVSGDIFPVRPNSGTANLYSVDTIPMNGDSIVISGRVVSEDIEGNIYKNMVIQDPITGDALKISADAGSLSGIFPIGQIISIKCNGLAIGKYAELYQLGVVYYNVDPKSEKTGYEPGRIPYSYFATVVQAVGLPEPNKIRVDTMTIAQVLSSTKTIHSKLICIKNAYFTGKEKGATIPLEANKIFAPSTSGVGYPQSRDITDGTGTIAIATSEYSQFAKKKLPADTYKGDITAIVGWYHDKASYAGSWQLTLRSLNDLGKGFEAYRAAN